MRAYLGGRALPREEFAIIGIGEATGVPVILLLEDGEVFTPEDYMSLGYTNYEVWCVGASGGRGGNGTEFFRWRSTTASEVAPPDIWEDVLSVADEFDAYRPGYLYNAYLFLSDTPPSAYHHRDLDWTDSYGNHEDGSGPYSVVRYWLTPRQKTEWGNPTHVRQFTTYHELIVGNGIYGSNVRQLWAGGGGGGGGLQVVTGLLDDLPASVAAEVGAQGADGALGQVKTAAPFDPSWYWRPPGPGRVVTPNEARWNWENRWDSRPTVPGPVEGSPGGASAFGDICEASGGKGGKPAVRWVGGVRQNYGDGGEGGIGGTTTPGGGAAGATTNSRPGADGGWNGSIGSGGGGGRGGGGPATEGGRGSLNFADTSVYGARGPLGTYTDIVHEFDASGAIVSTEQLITAIMNPGSGGGARLPGSRKYGSRALGYSHDGAVLIRLTKLD